MGLWKKCGGKMFKQIPTNIKPIDALFTATGEKGIPLSSVVAIAQEDFDDTTRFILLNLIENFLQKEENYICIYITYNKIYTKNIFEEFDKKIDTRNKLISCIDYLNMDDQLESSQSKIKSFLRIMDADFYVPNTAKKFKKFKDYIDDKKLFTIEGSKTFLKL